SLARAYRRLDRRLKRVKNVKASLSIWSERNRDIAKNGLRIHVDSGHHAAHRIGYIGLGDSVNMALASRDWHQERRRQRITRVLDELSQNSAARRVQNTDRTGRANPLEDVRNDCPVAQAASEPVAMGMSLSLSGRLAIDDVKTGSTVP